MRKVGRHISNANMSQDNSAPPQLVRNWVEDWLREAILRGQFRRGEWLRQQRVADQLEAANREAEIEFLGDGDGLLHYQHLRQQGEDDLRISRWFRFAARKGSIIMVMFTYVANRDDPDGRALAERAEMLDREIRNAVIQDPRTG